MGGDSDYDVNDYESDEENNNFGRYAYTNTTNGYDNYSSTSDID